MGRGTPIGDLLIEAGAINSEQLASALRLQQQRGGLVGQILVEMGACRSEDIAAALAKQFRFTQVDMATVVPRFDALLHLTGQKCRDLKLIPFERLGQLLCVAMVNVLNRKAITQVESLTRLKVKAFTSAWPEIQAAIDKYYTPEVEECAAKVEQLRTEEGTKAFELADKLAAELAAARKAPAETAPSRQAAPAAPAKAAPDIEAQKYIRDAQELRAKGRLEEAVKRLEAGAQAFPQSAQIRQGLEQLKKELEAARAQEAERRARVAELLAKGRAEKEAGRFAEAVAKFQEAAQLDPQNNVVARELSAAQKELARVKAEEAARKKVEEEARAAEERRKAEAEAKRRAQIAELLALAKTARAAGRLTEAESRLKDVLALDASHEVAKAQLAEVQAEAASARSRREEALAAALREARKLARDGRYEEATGVLNSATASLGEDPRIAAALHEVESAARQKAKEAEAASRRAREEEEKLKAEVRSLVEKAKTLAASGSLDEAEHALEDALALDPENVEAVARLGEVRELIRAKIEEEETRRRAEEERARRDAEVRELLREAAEDRSAGRLEMAARKLRALAASEGERSDVREALAAVEADIERIKAEEEARLRAEEEARRKAEEEIRRRAAAAAEAEAERRRTEAAVSGEKRLEAREVSLETLVPLTVLPEKERAALAQVVARRTGGLASSPQEALSRLPVAQIFSKSRAELERLERAAKAAEEALAAEAVVPTEEELGAELEPSLEPQPPMPDLEAQLDAEPEAIVEAVPADEVAGAPAAEAPAAEIAEAEVVSAEPAEVEPLEPPPAEVAPARAAAVPISDAEFAQLEPQLEPDPVQDWWLVHAVGGPVPAVPLED